MMEIDEALYLRINLDVIRRNDAKGEERGERGGSGMDGQTVRVGGDNWPSSQLWSVVWVRDGRYVPATDCTLAHTGRRCSSCLQ